MRLFLICLIAIYIAAWQPVAEARQAKSGGCAYNGACAQAATVESTSTNKSWPWTKPPKPVPPPVPAPVPPPPVVVPAVPEAAPVVDTAAERRTPARTILKGAAKLTKRVVAVPVKMVGRVAKVAAVPMKLLGRLRRR